MKKLTEAGLFGEGLIELVKPSIIARYNACLEDIGLKPTQLKKFSIDGWGWSPEIAEERKNPFYLSHNGPASPFAIIITPEQEDKPIYFPYHSYDKDLMRIVFHTSRRQITDLTTETGIWIDVDKEITTFSSPQDMLMIDSIQLRFNTPNKLMQAAKEQRELVRKFYEHTFAWGDEKLHKQIVDSSKKYGDLRFRSLDIPDTPYTHVRSFYSRAFGGIFVFRDLPNGKPLLILEEQDSKVSGELTHRHMEFNLRDKGLMDILIKEQLLETDMIYYQNNQERLHRLLDCLFVQACCMEYPEIDISNLASGKKKGLLVDLLKAEKLERLYLELERFIKQLGGVTRPELHEISPELQSLIAVPSSYLPRKMKGVVWKLLMKLSPVDVMKLYQYDKEGFFNTYKTWPENHQNWAAQYLKENYIGKPEVEPVNQ